MKNIYSKQLLLLFAIILTVVFSCKKESSVTKTATNPAMHFNQNSAALVSRSITGLSADTGMSGTRVGIYGGRFNPDSTKDSVFFNHVAAHILSATTTKIVAIVPKAAGTGVVTVKIGNTVTTGPVFNFIYTYSVSTYAGNGSMADVNGQGNFASFYKPTGIFLDSTISKFFVAESNGNIRSISYSHVVITPFRKLSSNNIFPRAIVVDNDSNKYITDNQDILQIKIQHDVVFAGISNDGGSYPLFNSPTGMAIDAQGNIYVTDENNNQVRKVMPDGSSTVYAGTGQRGYDNGPAASATFTQLTGGIALDKAGNLYVTDNNVIREISAGGTVSTFAGNIAKHGAKNGTGTSATFNQPAGLTVDKNWNVYVSDSHNNIIRKITQAGVVTTIAGNGSAASANGIGKAASFNDPTGITTDSAGNLYITDTNNNMVRKITLE